MSAESVAAAPSLWESASRGVGSSLLVSPLETAPVIADYRLLLSARYPVIWAAVWTVECCGAVVLSESRLLWKKFCGGIYSALYVLSALA